MRKVLISLAAAAGTLVIAAPAAAQYYGQPQGYGQRYGYGYGQNRGYSNWGAVNTLQRRIDNVERSLGGVRRDQVGRIAAEANALERRLHFAERNGLSRHEAHALDVEVGRLEQHLGWASVNRGYDRHDRYDRYDDRGDHRGHGRWERDDD